MILLSVNDVTKHYGPEPVLSGVTFDVRPGERVALVGPNGAGKTTLLRILAGLEEEDLGSAALHSSATLGFLQQQPEFGDNDTVWDEARRALDDLISLAARAEQLAREIADARDETQRQRLGEQLDRVQQDLHRRDGYHIDHKIERVLQGLGFDQQSFHQPLSQLSGGQQNRLMLAKLLLRQPGLMLLDEPSNHLDMEATRWLEDFLIDSGQTLIVVSHDRYLLDKVTNRTLELFRGTVDSYTGNYSAYRLQKAQRLEVQRRTHERQQAEIAKLQDFVRRHHYGQKHAQAEDRRKKLERIEPVDPPREIAAPPMKFPKASRTGDIVLRVENLAKGFGSPLFKDLTLDVLRGQRWGILGPNGCGKTTLLRCLLGQQTPDEGRVITGAGVRIGYVDQQLNCLNSGIEVVEAIRPSGKEMVESQRRDLLARFGITGDMVFQPVGSLSGGERSRAALALLAGLDANLLVLDEPTNHLDLWARESLERALREFDGTVLFVSHDRYFVNQIADQLLIIEHDRVRVVDGNYDTYLHLVKQELASSNARLDGGVTVSQESSGKRSKRDDRPRRKRKFPYRKTTDLEAEIHERETRIEELHEALASPEVLRDGERVKQCVAELEEQKQLLLSLYEHWEEAIELNS